MARIDPAGASVTPDVAAADGEPHQAPARPIRVGIVGFGKIGQLRADRLAAHPDFEVGAVCDVDPDRARLAGAATFHSDYRELLEEELDAVFVCAFNNVAPEIVIQALDRGRHVFCEKPPGRCVEDVEQIIEAERRNPGCKLKFGFNHRYHYSVIEAKAMVAGSRFGKVLWVRGVYGKCGGIQFENEWRNVSEIAGGGILLDQGIHMLDLCRYFCGDFDEVQSLVTTSFWNIPVEDNAFAILRSTEGAVAFVHSSATQWKHRFALDICLEGGYINLDGILSSTRSYGDEKLTFAKKQFEDETFAFGKPREETIFFGRDDSWSLEIDDFAQTIRDDRPVTSGNSTDALKVMQLIEKIYQQGQR